MEEEKTENVQLMNKIKEDVEKHLKKISDEGVTSANLENLYKLIDIHKDIENENYWKKKEEKYMRYYDDNMYGTNYGRRGYGDDNYGRGRSRDSMGRYKGDDMMNEMHENYRRYEEGRQGYGNNYGGNESMKALEYMLELNTNFIDMLKRDAKTPEERQIIDEYTRKMGTM